MNGFKENYSSGNCTTKLNMDHWNENGKTVRRHESRTQDAVK